MWKEDRIKKVGLGPRFTYLAFRDLAINRTATDPYLY